jgi:hypothetical protein
VLVGNMLGNVVFGLAAVWLCYRMMEGLGARLAPLA